MTAIDDGYRMQDPGDYPRDFLREMGVFFRNTQKGVEIVSLDMI